MKKFVGLKTTYYCCTGDSYSRPRSPSTTQDCLCVLLTRCQVQRSYECKLNYFTNIRRVIRLLDPNKSFIVQEKEQPTTIVESCNIHTFIDRPLLHGSHRVRQGTHTSVYLVRHSQAVSSKLTCGTRTRPSPKTYVLPVELPPADIYPSDDG